MRLRARPMAVLGILCLFIEVAAASAAAPNTGEVPVNRAEPIPVPAQGSAKTALRKAPDPVLAGFLGLIPLASGFYLTSTPHKGLAFTIADAVLIGSIWNIRRDDNLPDGDVAPYFVLLGAVNLADAALSLWQARSDEAAHARIRITLNASGEPVIGLAWNF